MPWPQRLGVGYAREAVPVGLPLDPRRRALGIGAPRRRQRAPQRGVGTNYKSRPKQAGKQAGGRPIGASAEPSLIAVGTAERPADRPLPRCWPPPPWLSRSCWRRGRGGGLSRLAPGGLNRSRQRGRRGDWGMVMGNVPRRCFALRRCRPSAAPLAEPAKRWQAQSAGSLRGSPAGSTPPKPLSRRTAPTSAAALRSAQAEQQRTTQRTRTKNLIIQVHATELLDHKQRPSTLQVQTNRLGLPWLDSGPALQVREVAPPSESPRNVTEG